MAERATARRRTKTRIIAARMVAAKTATARTSARRLVISRTPAVTAEEDCGDGSCNKENKHEECEGNDSCCKNIHGKDNCNEVD